MKPESVAYTDFKKRFLFHFSKEESYFNIKDKESIEAAEILTSLEKTQKELQQAYENLNFATDQDLIDSYIYEAKALQVKYEYFLKKAKERGMLKEYHVDTYKF